ncbi:MAG TPA: formylglycine-generating enzyme family protein [Pirellulales bacterium]|nr:formylglycine-generating enzyme family protein [Pirellulales bacterium]
MRARNSLAWQSVLLLSALTVRCRAAEPATFTNSLGMQFVELPAGEFVMGLPISPEQASQRFPDCRPSDFQNELPRHLVRITHSFYLGKYEVTIGQVRQFCRESGYKLEAERDGKSDWTYVNGKVVKRAGLRPWAPGWPVNDDHPAALVTWNDAQAFCAWLSRREDNSAHARDPAGSSRSGLYRLPTEAEWEYADRAGSTHLFSSGDNPEALARYGNVAGREIMQLTHNPRIVLLDAHNNKSKTSIPFPTLSSADAYPFTAPVGRFWPNAFGICDMEGNLREWCNDFYNRDYYAQSPTDDPQGPFSGSSHVVRGGAFFSPPSSQTASSRAAVRANARRYSIGFRVVYDPTGRTLPQNFLKGEMLICRNGRQIMR